MYLRDTLLRAAEAGLYRVHWSQEILDGELRNLVANQKMQIQQVNRLEMQINRAFPDEMLNVTDRLIPRMDNHEGDRHVLAAALIAKAHVIVTENLKQFPGVVLSQYQVEAQNADQFLTYLHDLFPQEIRQVLQNQASDLKKPPMSVTDLLNVLKTSVPNFVSRLN